MFISINVQESSQLHFCFIGGRVSHASLVMRLCLLVLVCKKLIAHSWGAWPCLSPLVGLASPAGHTHLFGDQVQWWGSGQTTHGGLGRASMGMQSTLSWHRTLPLVPLTTVRRLRGLSAGSPRRAFYHLTLICSTATPLLPGVCGWLLREQNQR